MFVAISVLVVAIFEAANAQTFSLGICDPNMKTMKNLDRNQYAGKWYINQHSESNFEEHTKCFAVNQDISENLNYDVNITYVSTMSDKKVYIINMAAKPDLPEYPERMTISPGYIAETQSVWVLHTDYDNFVVAYSCLNAFYGKLEVVWIGARTKQLDKKYLEKAQRVMKERRLNFKLIPTMQNCDF